MPENHKTPNFTGFSPPAWGQDKREKDAIYKNLDTYGLDYKKKRTDNNKSAKNETITTHQR